MTTGPRIAVCSQPTYLPWVGQFHRLALADVFVVMDTVAFSSTGWHNRNRVKGANGVFWLTVPVRAESKRTRRLGEVLIAADGRWQRRHWDSLRLAYGRSAHWHRYASGFEEVYLGRAWTSLLALDLALIRLLTGLLGIRTEIVLASRLGASGQGSALVLDQCRRAGASVYVSGLHGQDYLVERDFLAAGVSVFHQSFRAPVYRQRFGAFEPNLSVVDLLFNEGPASGDLLLAGNVDRRQLVAALAARPLPAVLRCDAAGLAAPDEAAVR